jgi:hypothetical protein
VERGWGQDGNRTAKESQIAKAEEKKLRRRQKLQSGLKYQQR